MKTFSVEKLANEPILVIRILADYRLSEHQFFSDSEARAVLDASDEKLFHIVDISEFKLSLDDIIKASNTAARGEQAIWHHPRNRAVIFISPNPVLKLAAAGLASAAFGNLQTKVFSTLDDALTWCRAELQN